ncbi:hypothetical protein MNBD_ALPHA04-513 [hydrothermal vent metagenome]|uniref:Uncharacterized protein n=1 Tax=hydrothermal vent metagenome TaxID=652676 RepID=A0A3B0RUP6_9ZZZZ
MLAFPVDSHPAMRLIELTGELSPQLSELGIETPFALLVARPEAQVLFHPLNNIEHALAREIENISTMGNLLGAAIELDSENADDSAAMGHIVKLVRAGAITKLAEPQGQTE